MKKIVIFFLAILLTGVSTVAQVAINHDHSQADASAVLDVKSTIRGVLIPRMTRAQMSDLADNISSNTTVNGLMAFNTDDGKLYIYVTATHAWKEVEYVTSGSISTKAVYTIGTGGSCSNTVVNGTYAKGATLNSSNTVTLFANVTTQGTWSITTNTVNGYSFSGSGTFTGTGTQQVTLNGSGTPAAGQTDTFTATADNSGGTCTFSVTVMGTVTGANNRIWLDRNLGASEVATSKTDADAYGDYYQWGRAADGHEKRNSTTHDGDNDGLADTPAPNLGNSWDGEFITTSNSPDDWLSTQDDNLWQGVSGVNNPCPAGFRLPTETELDNERRSWSSNNSDGAFGSPLKLTVAGWRAYDDGSLGDDGASACYWSSTVDDDEAVELKIESDDAYTDSDYRAYGQSVRCIKDQ